VKGTSSNTEVCGMEQKSLKGWLRPNLQSSISCGMCSRSQEGEKLTVYSSHWLKQMDTWSLVTEQGQGSEYLQTVLGPQEQLVRVESWQNPAYSSSLHPGLEDLSRDSSSFKSFSLLMQDYTWQRWEKKQMNGCLAVLM
jgi:hypothetical protein